MTPSITQVENAETIGDCVGIEGPRMRRTDGEMTVPMARHREVSHYSTDFNKMSRVTWTAGHAFLTFVSVPRAVSGLLCNVFVSFGVVYACVEARPE
jgi:hypothetical protein